MLVDERDPEHGVTGVGSAHRPIVNTHVHLPPNFSAFDTAAHAVAIGAAEGVTAIGTSNYHDLGVYRPFADAAADAGILPLFGLEIITLVEELRAAGTLVNDPSNPGRLYLCGKAITRFDPPTAAAERRLTAIRTASDTRMRAMCERVAARFIAAGLPVERTFEQITASVARRADVPVAWVSLQERHLAQAFQEALFALAGPDARRDALGRLIGGPCVIDVTDAVAVQEAIRSGLMKADKPAFVPEAAVSLEDALALILELGGIPCYPTLADGASPICGYETPPERLADHLLERGIHCAELIPARNAPAVVDAYVVAFRSAGIIVLAGTEHNTQRMIPLEPSCRDGAPLSEAARSAFFEGTCVIAAHQDLVGRGLAGYVDDAGRLAPGYADGEQRIRHFRERGEALLADAARRRAIA